MCKCSSCARRASRVYGQLTIYIPTPPEIDGFDRKKERMDMHKFLRGIQASTLQVGASKWPLMVEIWCQAYRLTCVIDARRYARVHRMRRSIFHPRVSPEVEGTGQALRALKALSLPPAAMEGLGSASPFSINQGFIITCQTSSWCEDNMGAPLCKFF
ncbi:hypothetical protein E3N88_41793 [Mikania micrantha]|uniref:Uncharacterized protein n=1 Tax=Mikania micrantha TaxID=192012 RepID=A0A5N6LJP2_9ASTR|nr:hypothetical protein E3N88_41793 [Mikania micrantha]